MSTQPQQEEFLTIRDLWEIFIKNFKLFVVSVSVALFVAVLYILVTPPTYQRDAAILLKDEEQGNSIGSAAGSAMQGFESLGLFNTNVNVNNEVDVIQTVSAMEEVVRRLGINYNYSRVDRVCRSIDLYSATPFRMSLDSLLEDRSFECKLRFVDADHYEIKGFKMWFGPDLNRIPEVNDLGLIRVGDKVETPYGDFVLQKTALFVDSLDADCRFEFQKTSVKGAAKAYLKKTTVALRSDDQTIIDLSITDMNIHRANNVLNTLISVYNENWIKDKNRVTISTSQFIDERLLVIQRELNAVEDDISDFKSRTLMPDYVAVTGLHLQQSQEIKMSLLEFENQLSMAQYIQSYLQNANADDQLLPANTGLESTAIENLIAEYNELMLQKNVLVTNSSAKNPIVADLITNLLAMRGVINTSVNDYIKTLDIQIENAMRESEKNTAELASNPQQAKELLAVERQQMVKQSLYLYLLQKREENELSQAFSAHNTKILSLADGDSTPVKPSKIIVLLFALILGGALPVVYIILQMTFDTVVKSKKDLETLKVPFVGSIPTMKELMPKKRMGITVSEGQDGLVVSAGGRTVANEAFRVLRTNLDFLMPRRANDAVVMQTLSINPGSGKSFVVANLAVSMAVKESHVLIIDADMRRGGVSQFIQSPKVGLSNYLSEHTDQLDEVIHKGILQKNVDVIPVGVVPPNPSELLLSERFAEMITILKTRYDYIFIDCPPVDIVPDSAIVAPLCDTAMFVVRAGLLDKRLLPEIDKQYESKKFNNMCLILNDVDLTGSGYYYNIHQAYGRYGIG